jgi:hypothetical protein
MSPILKDEIRKNAIAKYFLGAGFEVRPFHWLLIRFLGNNVGDYLVALAEFPRAARLLICASREAVSC